MLPGFWSPRRPRTEGNFALHNLRTKVTQLVHIYLSHDNHLKVSYPGVLADELVSSTDFDGYLWYPVKVPEPPFVVCAARQRTGRWCDKHKDGLRGVDILCA